MYFDLLSLILINSSYQGIIKIFKLNKKLKNSFVKYFQNGELQIYDQIIQYSSFINVTGLDMSLDTMFLDASRNKLTKLCNYLIQIGANIRTMNDSALISSIIRDDLKATKFFLHKGCKLNRKIDSMIIQYCQKIPRRFRKRLFTDDLSRGDDDLKSSKKIKSN